MDGPRALSTQYGCLNPLCPRANWCEKNLPRWWVRLDDGQLCEFAACDEACARAGIRFVQVRLGRAERDAELTHASAFA
jgi:hypothetical protein